MSTSRRDSLSSLRPASPWRAWAAAIVLPGAVTLFGVLVPVEPESIAVLYLLAVVVSAAAGGAFAGLGAALLSFLGLNYFFTPPVHTFRVDKGADLLALLVFLVVSVIVGMLLARATRERARAERGEREARLLADVASSLLSDGATPQSLTELAGRIARVLGRGGSVRIVLPEAEPAIDVRAGDEAAGDLDAPPFVAPVPGAGEDAGISVWPERPLSDRRKRLISACAQEIGLAVEREHLDAQVRSARLESEATKLQSALFSSVTHDLRTPLASLKAGVSSLLDESTVHDPDQVRELLQTTLEETDRLNRLLGNILDLAKIRAGALTLAVEPTHLDEIVEAVVTRLRPRLEGHRVRAVIRPDLPPVPVDPVLIDQVLTNLIENAARYSPAGTEISVTLAAWHDGVEITVNDQGPGIPAERRDAVFEAFVREDAGGGRSGSGLGLAIARAVVVAHGGWIEIQAAPGGGTSVSFGLPAGPGRANAPVEIVEGRRA